MVRVVIGCCLLSFVSPQTKKEEEGASGKVPELKTLDHYVGTWDVEFTSKDFPFTKAKVTAKWVLNGRFVEQTGEAEGKDGAESIKLKTLYTFDSRKNAYRSWVFSSDGSVTEADIVWDAKTKIMTSISHKNDEGGFSTTTADFSQPGIETWKIAITDGVGNFAAEIAGKNTQQKKAIAQ